MPSTVPRPARIERPQNHTLGHVLLQKRFEHARQGRLTTVGILTEGSHVQGIVTHPPCEYPRLRCSSPIVRPPESQADSKALVIAPHNGSADELPATHRPAKECQTYHAFGAQTGTGMVQPIGLDSLPNWPLVFRPQR